MRVRIPIGIIAGIIVALVPPHVEDGDERMNGGDVGQVWLPSYRLEISDCVVRRRANYLENCVTTNWTNRLIDNVTRRARQRKMLVAKI